MGLLLWVVALSAALAGLSFKAHQTEETQLAEGAPSELHARGTKLGPRVESSRASVGLVFGRVAQVACS